MTPEKFIHLLYAPTNFCNMGCQYCYLGHGTDQQTNKTQIVSTLSHAVDALLQQGIYPFNLSFHGGEPTAIPAEQLAQLLDYASRYYQQHAPLIRQHGFPVNPVHIKTNLYNFDRLYDLFDHYQVSISGSVDLPLSLHQRYRTDKQGHSTLNHIMDNLRLLAAYPHHKKISCVITKAHFQQCDQLIADIKKLHHDIGLDMTRFNIMFAFDSEQNQQKFQHAVPGTEMLNETEQVQLYQALEQAFAGTELEPGLRQHWFKEFTPEFCCSAVNCGDKFFLLQSNGDVYACPRGQSSRRFFYGNIFQDSVEQICQNGWQTIEAIENQLPIHADCTQCQYLPYCNQGCVFVREQTGQHKSYTCQLQQVLYRADPQRYPPYDETQLAHYRRQYLFQNKFATIDSRDIEPRRQHNITEELYQPEQSLAQLIAQDDVLQLLYDEQLFYLQVDQQQYRLRSPLLDNQHPIILLTPHQQVFLYIRMDCLARHCQEPVNNYLLLMLLRNTLVTYGDERRQKQEHLADYCLYHNSLIQQSDAHQDYYRLDLSPWLQFHQSYFLPGVRNNLYLTSKTLREYHYAKQRKNAFYHIQAINLPFPYIEFYWQSTET